jgi:hypothetical protein
MNEGHDEVFTSNEEEVDIMNWEAEKLQKKILRTIVFLVVLLIGIERTLNYSSLAIVVTWVVMAVLLMYWTERDAWTCPLCGAKLINVNNGYYRLVCTKYPDHNTLSFEL